MGWSFCRRAAVVETATVSFDEATVSYGVVTTFEEETHDASAGNPEQLDDASKVNPDGIGTDAGAAATEGCGGVSTKYSAETTWLGRTATLLTATLPAAELSETTAMARSVFEAATVMGPAYIGELVVGVAPLVV